MAIRFDFPQFLEADAVGLRIAPFIEPETLLQAFTEAAAAAFGKECIFRVQFHPRRIARGLLAALADAHVAGGNASDAGIGAAFAVEQYLGGGKTGVDLHT